MDGEMSNFEIPFLLDGATNKPVAIDFSSIDMTTLATPEDILADLQQFEYFDENCERVLDKSQIEFPF